ncbi:WD40 repeat-containing protein [Cylindrospermum stagnale PCC 7417]|uniref:WD40 repeat-containing protein n=2 Tax=Cylindrospermum stagnale TaxID=142864 RepID=K9X627_9NOST|nr:WD40 repeat-containing protein [Cylindrospermum stagnale PCC 7417]
MRSPKILGLLYVNTRKLAKVLIYLESRNNYFSLNIMTMDLRRFFQATNPCKTIAAGVGLVVLAVTANCQAQGLAKPKQLTDAIPADSFYTKGSANANAVSAQISLSPTQSTSDADHSAFKVAGKLKPGEGLRTNHQIMTTADAQQPEQRTLTGHSDLVISVAVSADGKTLASSSADGTIKLWDITTGKLIKTLNHRYQVYGVAWNRDSKTLASVSGNEIIIWNVTTGKRLKTLTGSDGFWSVTWSPNGKKLASGSWDKTIRLWDANTGKIIKTLTGHTSEVYNVVWSPDSKTLASGSGDSTIKLWNGTTGKFITTLNGHRGTVYGLAWSPDSKTLASASTDRTIKLWNITTGELITTLTGHSDAVGSVDWSADGKTLASSSADNTIKLWDASTGKFIKTLNGHKDIVLSVAWSADGKTLASASRDKTVKLWNVDFDN